MEKNYNVLFTPQLNVAEITQQINKIKKTFDGVNLDSAGLKNVSGIFNSLEANLAKIKSSTGLTVTGKQAAQLGATLNNVAKDFKALEVIGKNLKIDPENLMPKAVLANLREYQTQLKTVQNQLKDLAKLEKTALKSELAKVAGVTPEKAGKGLSKAGVSTTADITYERQVQAAERLTTLNEQQKNIEAQTVNYVKEQVATYQQLESISDPTKRAAAQTQLAQQAGLYKADLEGIAKGERDIEAVAVRSLKTRSDEYKETTKQITATKEELALEQNLWEVKQRIGAKNEGRVSDLQNQALALQGKIAAETKAGMDSYNKEMQETAKVSGTVAAQVTTASESFKQETQAASASTIANKKLGDSFSTITSQISRFVGAAALIQAAIRGIRDTVTTLKELDKAYTEIAIVSGQTREQAWGNFKSMADMATLYGRSISEVADASVIFYQQGLKAAEVTAMTEAALVNAALGGVSLTEATDTLTAAIRGYNDEVSNAMDYTDKMAAVGAYSAANFQELSSSMDKVASAAYAAGIDFDHLMGYLGKMIETTRQAPESLGSALNTVIARFQQLKEAPESLLETGESFNDVQTALESVGVALLDSTGQFRDLDEVIDELGGKWSGLDRNTQKYIATVAAGTRQQSRFLAMMSDYDRTLDLIRVSSSSAGAAMQQYAVYTDSVEAAQNRLTAATQQLQMNFLSSDVFKAGIDGLTAIVSALSSVPPALLLVGATATAVFGKMAKEMATANLTTAMSGGPTGGGGAYQKVLGAVTKIVDSRKKETAQLILQTSLEKQKSLWTETQNKAKKLDVALGEKEVALEQIDLALSKQGLTTQEAENLSAVRELVLDEAQEASKVAQLATDKARLVATQSIASAQLLINVGIGAALIGITLLVGQIQKWADGAGRIADAEERANNARTKATDLKSSIDEYEKLSGIISKTAEEEEQYSAIKEDLVRQYPILLDYIDSEGNLHLKNIDILREELDIRQKIAREESRTATKTKLNELSKGTIKAPGDLSQSMRESLEADLPDWMGADLMQGWFGTITDVNDALDVTDYTMAGLARTITQLQNAPDADSEYTQNRIQEINEALENQESIRQRLLKLRDQERRELGAMVTPLFADETLMLIDEYEQAGNDLSAAAKDFLVTAPNTFIDQLMQRTADLPIAEATKEIQAGLEEYKIFINDLITNNSELMDSLALLSKIADQTGASMAERQGEVNNKVAEYAATGANESQVAIFKATAEKSMGTSSFESTMADFLSTIAVYWDQATKVSFTQMAGSLSANAFSMLNAGLTAINDPAKKAEFTLAFKNLFDNPESRAKIDEAIANLEGKTGLDLVAAQDNINRVLDELGVDPEYRQAMMAAFVPPDVQQSIEDEIAKIVSETSAAITNAQSLIKTAMEGTFDLDTALQVAAIDPSLIQQMTQQMDGSYQLSIQGIQTLANAENARHVAAMQDMIAEENERLGIIQGKITDAQQEVEAQQKVVDAIKDKTSAEYDAAQASLEASQTSLNGLNEQEAAVEGAIGSYELLADAASNLSVGTGEATFDYIYQLTDALAAEADAIIAAQSEMETYGQVSQSVYDSLIASNAAYADAFYVTSEGIIMMDNAKAEAIMGNSAEEARAGIQAQIVQLEAANMALEAQMQIEGMKMTTAAQGLAALVTGNGDAYAALNELQRLNGINFATVEGDKATVSATVMEDILNNEAIFQNNGLTMTAQGLTQQARMWDEWAGKVKQQLKDVQQAYKDLLEGNEVAVGQKASGAIAGTSIDAKASVNAAKEYTDLIKQTGEDGAAAAAEAAQLMTKAFNDSIVQAAQNIKSLQAQISTNKTAIGNLKNLQATITAEKELGKARERNAAAQKKSGGDKKGAQAKEVKEIEKINDLIQKQAELVENLRKAWKDFEITIDDISATFQPFTDQFDEYVAEYEEFYNYQRKLEGLANQGQIIENYISNPLLAATDYVNGFKAAIGNVVATSAISLDYIKQLRASMEKQAQNIVDQYGAYYQFDSAGQIYQDYSQLQAEVPAAINEQRQNVLEAKRAKNAKENEKSILKVRQEAAEATEKLYQSMYDSYAKSYDDAAKEVLKQQEAVAKGYEAVNEALTSKGGADPKTLEAANKQLAENEAILAKNEDTLSKWETQMKSLENPLSGATAKVKEQKDAMAALEKEMQLLEFQQLKEERILEGLEKYTEDMSKAVAKYEETYASLTEQIQKAQEQLQKLIQYRQTAADTATTIEQALFDSIMEGYDRELKALENVNKKKEDFDNKRLAAIRANIDEERRLRDRAAQADQLYQKQQRANLLEREGSGAYSSELAKLKNEIESMRRANVDTMVDDEYERLKKEVDARAELFKQESEALQEQIEYYRENSQLIWQQVNAIMLQGSDSVIAQLESTAAYMNASALQQQLQQEAWSQQVALTLEVTVNKMLVELDNMINAYQSILMTDIPEIDAALKENANVYDQASYNLLASMNTYSSTFNGLVQSLADVVGNGIYQARDLIVAAAQAFYNDLVSQMNAFDAKVQGIKDQAKQEALPVYETLVAENVSEGSETEEMYPGAGSKTVTYQGKKVKVSWTDELDWKKKKKTYGFKQGGYVDYTGLAMVHGTPAKPELMLNSKQTQAFTGMVDHVADNRIAGMDNFMGGGLEIGEINIQVSEIASSLDIKDVARAVVSEIDSYSKGRVSAPVTRRI